MNKREHLKFDRLRLITFAFVAALHLIIIFFVAFTIKTVVSIPEPVAGVMKLVDVEERLPPEQPPDPRTNTDEAVAETMIETDEVVVQRPSTQSAVSDRIDYLPQHKLSILADIPDDQIRRNVIYPPIAYRSNIEGNVYLDLFIDIYGYIREVRILREDPPNRGFGEAAVNALKGIRGKPAEANGVHVASRLRYNLKFTLN
jgi:protein TonB